MQYQTVGADGPTTRLTTTNVDTLSDELLAIRMALMDEAAQKKLYEELRKLVGEVSKASAPDVAARQATKKRNLQLSRISL